MMTATRTLVTEVVDAHGGLVRWRTFSTVASRVVTGGSLWSTKGFPMDDTARTITSHFRRQWTRVEPFGAPGWHMDYEPGRVVIETAEGEAIGVQDGPRETFAGHQWDTPWTPLQLGYFNGYAMWTYYNLPFLLGEPGIVSTGIPPVSDGGAMLRGLRVRFPPEVHSHCPEQDLYFDDSGLLRRQDYTVDVAGGAPAAHLISGYIDVQGLLFATSRRVFPRNQDGSIQEDRLLVSIDLSGFELS